MKTQTAITTRQAPQALARLNDIISEVDRQLNVLKRQAAKARRYRLELSHESNRRRNARGP